MVELWDTCNNMVICWILGSVSESIARSVMFVGTVREIWQQLENRFALSDGSRKYKLNKDTYAITQSYNLEDIREVVKEQLQYLVGIRWVNALKRLTVGNFHGYSIRFL
ncbi:hypothetical protein CTI12_AA046290 [Artemisia annua]|uniref:Uncharacterized protein n=1 Tax=Artemisia annua TaxID=35608 RepID=A0A2U1QCG3_ARTAN|nr:hypothetical protein CTI12_AA046290 [Artemisia annua]